MTAARASITIAADTSIRSTPRPRGMSRLEAAGLRFAARIDRLLRWEFWPSWIIYLPLIPHLAWLSVRYRGATTCTACNPGIPFGGLVGESKQDILALLPADAIVPTELLPPSPLLRRESRLAEFMLARQWGWPIILKPDVGERGAGVRLIQSPEKARDYLRAHPLAVIVQQYHPGPFEAGVFYVRHPDQPIGRIFSITDKRFASVNGDGRSSLRTLIWRHPRYRTQASVYLRRLADRADEVPANGETVSLGIAGNHCQGAMFLDGTRLITPELTAAFDSIARRTPGFHFGRFDVRYRDESEFKAGRGFSIVELNGLLSESTNIYDPSATFWQAQRTLREQWRLAFQIGSALRSRGTPVPSFSTAALLTLRELLSNRTDAHAD